MVGLKRGNMATIGDRVDKIENEIYRKNNGLCDRVTVNSKWKTQTEVKLNILFVALTFLAVTFSGLLITLLFEIVTHKITLVF